MKLRALDLLVCPACQGKLYLDQGTVEALDYSDEWLGRLKVLWEFRQKIDATLSWEQFLDSYRCNVLDGELSCTSCDAIYPIESGVPRMLPAELRTQTGKMGRGDPATDARLTRFEDNRESVVAEDAQFLEIQRANQSNYGYEWQAFSHEYEEWSRLHARYSGMEDGSFFQGKIGLDGGCGMGRYSLVPASHGAEMLGVDLSNAIEAAYAKSRTVPTFHAVQGDLFNLPVQKRTFDYAQSLGVIHITPNPELALQNIRAAVKPGGRLSLYVYASFEDENKFKFYLLKLVNQFRRFTVRMPSDKLYKLLYLPLPFVLVLLYFPSWVLWQLGFKKASMRFPYSYEQYRGRRIRDMHMNLFDRFGNPVERRYSRQEMQDWMARAEVKDPTLLHRDGWVVVGTNGDVEGQDEVRKPSTAV